MSGNTSVLNRTSLAPPKTASINLHELHLLQESHGVEAVEPCLTSPVSDVVARWQELTGEPVPLGVLRREAKRAMCDHSLTKREFILAGRVVDTAIVEALANPDLGLRVVRLRKGRR